MSGNAPPSVNNARSTLPHLPPFADPGARSPAGQGFNGRMLEIRRDRIVVEAESRYDKDSIAFGEHVTVHGRRLPATLSGRIGIAVRRTGGQWRATACDVVPGWRMANALSGHVPCPRPRVRIAGASVQGRTVELRLRLIGDVTGLRVSWDGTVRRSTLEPGVRDLTVRRTFRSTGRQLIRVRVVGAAGPGCGTTRSSAATAQRAVRIER